MMSSQGFDPKDLEEICAKKPSKYKMKRADFKELGRNIMLGSVDVAIGCLGAAALTVAAVGALNNQPKNSSKLKDGFRDGHSGYGYYVGDVRSDDE